MDECVGSITVQSLQCLPRPLKPFPVSHLLSPKRGGGLLSATLTCVLASAALALFCPPRVLLVMVGLRLFGNMCGLLPLSLPSLILYNPSPCSVPWGRWPSWHCPPPAPGENHCIPFAWCGPKPNLLIGLQPMSHCTRSVLV